MKGNWTTGSERKSTGMLGKQHTLETRQKISLANRGRVAWNRGKHHSTETGWVLVELWEHDVKDNNFSDLKDVIP
jgi:hypothetical protein